MECYAVRPGLYGALDAVRTLYAGCLRDIHEAAEGYRQAWSAPALKLHHTATRGYHLLLPLSAQVSVGTWRWAANVRVRVVESLLYWHAA